MKFFSEPQPGSDLLMHIKLRPEEAVPGLTREIKVLHSEPCVICNGTGSATKQIDICSKCWGSGQMDQAPCRQCRGTGKKLEKVCSQCRGTGHTRVKRTVIVSIPAGMKSGIRLRLKGMGEAGDYGAEKGDLFIEVHVLSHEQSLLEKIFYILKNFFFGNGEVEILPKKISNNQPSDIKSDSQTDQTTQVSKPVLDRICPNCKRAVNHKDIIQCGPCERLFCTKIDCWESHRWSHGKSPAVGISYSGDGSFTGFDGSEGFK